METRTVWKAVVDALVAEGVDKVFGLPGNPMHLVADLEKHSNIKNVLVRHEHSGAAMAYAVARVTGEPAVCYGNPGPGITNMVTALLEATSASLPVIALSAGTPLSISGKGAFQELDSVSLMQPVTKWATQIVAPESTSWVMQRAFSIARAGRPGAVFIDIPSDIGLMEANIPVYRPPLRNLRSRPNREAVEKAASMLTSARSPLAICGSGAINAAAYACVEELAELLGMPVFSTPGGRGILSEDHDLAFGQVGLYFTEPGRAYFDQADLVLSIGSRLEEFSTGSWKLWPTEAELIRVDNVPEAISLNIQPELALVGDAALVLDDVISMLPPINKEQRDQRMAAICENKKAFFAEIMKGPDKRGECISARQVVEEISSVFGKDTIMVHENGGADLWTYYWPYYRVRDIGGSVPMGEQTAMGMGVIGAIGAKIAKPDKKVVCVCGDGAMQMAMMELATAAEQKCGITWVVLNNRALGWSQYIQRLEGEQIVATDFATSPNFCLLAEAQGCKGILVKEPDRVTDALRMALRENSRGVPVLIEVEIAKHEYPEHFENYHREVWGLGRVDNSGESARRCATTGVEGEGDGAENR